ncbi:MAG: class I SAM-dependent methyltransferase [Verrucomicrobiota bacterium]|nr:class I SAM-dependent methyltransferase [Verrucomicrobiota bacterium]
MKALKRAWTKWQCKPFERFREIDGWLTDNEALALYQTARALPSKSKIVEIGSWKGKSTFCLASGLQDGVIVAIDPFDAAGEAGSKEIYDGKKGDRPLLEQFKENLNLNGLLEKIDIRKGYSADFAGSISDIDFLFIDGDHSQQGCEYDYRTFGPSVKKGGYLAFHDYDPKRMELGPTFVIETIVKKEANWVFQRKADSLMLFRKAV